MHSSDRFREGLIFFNAGQYFEAHEAWEDVWRSTEQGALKSFLQGLIQAAVALHHLGRGNTEGARSQLSKSIRNLRMNTPPNSVVDVVNLIEQLEKIRQEMKADKVQIRGANLW